MVTIRNAAATVLLLPALAAAQAASEAPRAESQLWWMWVAVAVVLVGALAAIFMSREPRSRARR
jgi:membrane protein YdbS with pleckstrin-like domain